VVGLGLTFVRSDQTATPSIFLSPAIGLILHPPSGFASTLLSGAPDPRFVGGGFHGWRQDRRPGALARFRRWLWRIIHDDDAGRCEHSCGPEREAGDGH
jgi:hypothetical protein